MSRNWLRGGALAAGSVVLAGCQFGGLNSIALPGTAGHGPGSYKVTVELTDVATLPQNSPVMVDDVTVGSVSGIQAASERMAASMPLWNWRWTTTWCCRPMPPPRWRRRRCSAPSTSTWPRRWTSHRWAGSATARGSPNRAPAAIPPPKRSSRRWAWWSTKAILVPCKRLPMRHTGRWRAGRASSPTSCPSSRS
ncbi:putative lprM protein [Mycobacterium xenopi 4042]|uniref:Putative lprM protein n=1 Tax=Mycobacterium xenopi 4042 TaxID=1299334 RepID=X7ZUI9_MYCXE|nr:putative lprM protein [Mycobacterium xenopi 4042]